MSKHLAMNFIKFDVKYWYTVTGGWAGAWDGLLVAFLDFVVKCQLLRWCSNRLILHLLC